MENKKQPQVKLKFMVKQKCVALNFAKQGDARILDPTPDYNEATFTVAKNADQRALFLVGEDHVARFLYGTIGAFKLLFEAEKFLEIMERFPNKDRLVFFKHAYLPNIIEANKFLALVDNSNLSKKDVDRAYSWAQELAKRQGLTK